MVGVGDGGGSWWLVVGSGRDEVVVELWRKRKQHIEQTRKDKCAQRKWHSNQACALDDFCYRYIVSFHILFFFHF